MVQLPQAAGVPCESDVLPESQLGCSLPELVNLGLITLENQLVVHHEQRVGRNVVGEWWEGDQSGHTARVQMRKPEKN